MVLRSGIIHGVANTTSLLVIISTLNGDCNSKRNAIDILTVESVLDTITSLRRPHFGYLSIYCPLSFLPYDVCVFTVELMAHIVDSESEAKCSQ